MTHVLRSIIPKDIVDIIKLYTGEGCWRNGKYIQIHRIPKDDCRYTMLRKRPMIKQIYNDNKYHPLKGSVWFKLDNGKFVVISVSKNYIWDETQKIHIYFWEMHYNQTQTLYYI